jgi:hypothetical protein
VKPRFIGGSLEQKLDLLSLFTGVSEEKSDISTQLKQILSK